VNELGKEFTDFETFGTNGFQESKSRWFRSGLFIACVCEIARPFLPLNASIPHPLDAVIFVQSPVTGHKPP
jgi:hypothetical protein